LAQIRPAPQPKRRARTRVQRKAEDAGKRWSGEVMRKSNALDLEPGVFARDDPHEIAASLKRSAEASRRRKAEPFRSAMSMLNFYINRAGRNLAPERRRVLEAAKDELRALFGRSATTQRRSRHNGP